MGPMPLLPSEKDFAWTVYLRLLQKLVDHGGNFEDLAKMMQDPAYENRWNEVAKIIVKKP